VRPGRNFRCAFEWGRCRGPSSACPGRLRALCVLVLSLAGVQAAAAQVFESRAAEDAIARSLIEVPGQSPSGSDLVLPGIQLESVSIFSGYSSNALVGSGIPAAPGLISGIGSETDYGGQATFSWRHLAPNTSVGIRYTPRYIGRARFDEWNRFDHDLSLTVDTTPSSRWALVFNGTAALFGSEQFFFDPPVFRNVSNPPETLPDLAEGARAGEFSDEEIASILTGSPVVESEGGRDLDLSRILTTTGGMTARYSQSSRLSWNFGASLSRNQFVSGRRNLGAGDERQFLPGTRSVTGNSGFSYRASRRTSMGASFTVTRSSSNVFPEATHLTERVFWTRRFSRRWSAGVQGGHGLSRFPRAAGGGAVSTETFQTWVAGGNVNYSGSEHSLTSSVNRTVGDSFGLGARTTTSTSVSWRWQPRGRYWSLDGRVAGMVSRVAGFNNITTWTVTIGHSRVVDNHTVVRWEYSYGDFSSQLVGLLSNLTRHRVQFSLTWTPAARSRRGL